MQRKDKSLAHYATVFVGGLVLLTIISGVVLSSSIVSALAPPVTSTDYAIDNVDITIPVSCNLTSIIDSSHTATIENGRNITDIGTTTLKVFCNDNSGFAIYAAGYTNEVIGETNSNKLIGVSGQTPVGNISTGIATSGNTSNWSMKLIKVTNTSGQDPVTYNPENLTILSDTEGSFANYHTVPNEYTKVATFSSATDFTLGSVLQTTYQAYVSPTQPAGAYTGKVIYVLVHPSSASSPSTNCAPGQLVMQNVSEWESSVASGNEVTACDARDGKTYTVARLADGNLWMTQNLDHDIVADGSVTYDSTTTNLPSGVTWIPERATYATGTTTWGLYNSTTGDHDGMYRPESYDPGNYYWNGTIDDSNDWNDYLNSCTFDDDTWLPENCDETLNPINTYVSGTGNSHYHLGNFYNWTAAIAMNNSSSYTTDGTTVSQSICPAGWTLPQGGVVQSSTSGSFQYLIEHYGWEVSQPLSNAAYNSPIYLSLGDTWYGIHWNIGSYGRFWSSTVIDNTTAYSLYVSNSNYLHPGNTIERNMGVPIRCVVPNPNGSGDVRQS